MLLVRQPGVEWARLCQAGVPTSPIAAQHEVHGELESVARGSVGIARQNTATAFRIPACNLSRLLEPVIALHDIEDRVLRNLIERRVILKGEPAIRVMPTRNSG